MKKYLIVSLLLSAIVACGDNKTEGTKETATETTNNLSSNPDYQKGLALIAKNDCLTCHKVDTKLTGPAYRDVANKYSEKDITTLAQKVIKGGQGVWGAIPMTPHPALAQADAEQMIKYILLLKK